MTPAFMSADTASMVLPVAVRIALTFMFWFSGLTKLIDFRGTVKEMEHFGLAPPAPIAAGVIVILLGGSGLIIEGHHVWLGALILGVFTLLTIPIAHDFWNETGEAAMVKKHFVVEHLSIVGALALVALLNMMP
jgi:transmembrane protein